MESPAARVAALSTGDVDIADAIPARDVGSLKQRGADVASISAARINFLQFDVEKETVAGVTDKQVRSLKPVPGCRSDALWPWQPIAT